MRDPKPTRNNAAIHVKAARPPTKTAFTGGGSSSGSSNDKQLVRYERRPWSPAVFYRSRFKPGFLREALRINGEFDRVLGRGRKLLGPAEKSIV